MSEEQPETPQVKKKSKTPMVAAAAVICAAIGAGGAYVLLPQLSQPSDALLKLSADVERLSAELAQTRADLSAAQASNETARAALSETLTNTIAQIDVATELTPLIEKIAGFEEKIAAFETQFSELKSPSPDAKEIYEAELAELRSIMTEEIARLEALEESSRASEQAAAQAVALQDLTGALERGAPYSDLLESFETVPKGLADFAQTGVASQADLQAELPDLARAVIAAEAQASYERGEMTAVQNFLYTQLGYRSTKAQDGAGVDATLSRVEAALLAEDLPSVLEEISTLSESAQETLAAWTAQVEGRKNAVLALEELKR